MTIQEAHRQFNLFLDKVSSESTPEFTHKQIDVFIHEAEVRIVKQAYGRNNIYKKGYQEVQKRTDDLNTLVKSGYISQQVDKADNGILFFPLDTIYKDKNHLTVGEPYMFFLRAQVEVTNFDTITGAWTDVTLIPHDKYTQVIKDPFNKSRISSPIIFFEDGAIKVDTNSGASSNAFDVTQLKLSYICYPRRVSWQPIDGALELPVDSMLPEEKQREAIQLAVLLAIEGVESQRLQGNTGLLNTQE
jgi:hypothetical protein